MEDYIGLVLNNRYEILEKLGVGGMAYVYKANDLRLNRLVAVKILKPELQDNASIRKRFLEEAQTVSQLSHPNIVNVFDCNRDEDIDYFVMELVDGITLKQYIQKRGGILNWREALHFITQIMKALETAHQKNIVHRDVKPQNIMVLRNGDVKLADFGIASIMDTQKTFTVEVFGSVHYISPEQAQGRSVDQRSDIYSAGVVLYEMLTGRLPYEAETPVAVAMQHINSVPLAPRDLNPDIPVAFEQITMKAMSSDLSKRYSSATEMLGDLEAFRKNPNIIFDYTDGLFLSGLANQDPDATAPLPKHFKQYVEKPVETVLNDKDNGQNSDTSTENTSTESRRNLYVVLGVVGVILLIIFIMFRMLWVSIFSGIFGNATEYIVPNLSGMSYSEAEDYLYSQADLNGHFKIIVSDETVYNAAYETGDIVSQEPASGNITKSDVTEITVVLCAEPEEETKLVMPNYIGADYDTTADILSSDYGVIVRYNPVYSDTVEEGKIISTEPEAGSELTAGQNVTVTYSLGQQIVQVEVPSLIDKTENQAKEVLDNLGLECGSVTSEYSTKKAGNVISQSVDAGTKVEVGTTVDIVISSGEEPSKVDTTKNNNTDTDDTADNGTDTFIDDFDTGFDDTDTIDNTQDNTTQNPIDETHHITVMLPENLEDNSTLVIKINGIVYWSSNSLVGTSQTVIDYTGTIESIEILLNNEQYNNYSIT